MTTTDEQYRVQRLSDRIPMTRELLDDIEATESDALDRAGGHHRMLPTIRRTAGWAGVLLFLAWLVAVVVMLTG